MSEERLNKMYHDMAVEQGYVPETCTLPGTLVFGLVSAGEDPCTGCNDNRDTCKGRAKGQKDMSLFSSGGANGRKNR